MNGRVYRLMTTKHRRLVQSVLVSLNGICSEPMAWAGPYFGPASALESLAALKRSDGLLMGRGTYEIFSRQWPQGTGPYADYVSRMPKYVFSSTITEAAWTNTTVIGGDVVAGVRALKSAGGNDLIVYGHGRFGQTLVDAGLVDELNLTIIPVFVPDGEPLFRAGGEQHRWKLIRTDEGPDPDLASLTYEPTNRKEYA